jgi:hypothetical protein
MVNVAYIAPFPTRAAVTRRPRHIRYRRRLLLSRSPKVISPKTARLNARIRRASVSRIHSPFTRARLLAVMVAFQDLFANRSLYLGDCRFVVLTWIADCRSDQRANYSVLCPGIELLHKALWFILCGSHKASLSFQRLMLWRFAALFCSPQGKGSSRVPCAVT